MSLRVVRWLCGLVFVAGIVTMIVASVNGNNNGWVVTAGLITAVAALVLLATCSVAGGPVTGSIVDEIAAARVEQRIEGLVAAGTDESAVRELVRDALRLGRTAGA